MKEKADLAASVAARLLNRARESGDEHQSLLTSYCLERSRSARRTEEATTVFLDLDYMLTRDAVERERFVAIGMSRLARVLFVVHCERGQRVRIVSARRATRREHEAYDRRRESD